MTDIFSANNLLDDLLQRIGTKLQISKTQRELAEQRYNAVGTWLSKDEILFGNSMIEIYPQGSLSISTTVKPLSKQEFDLDLVCQINQSWQGKDPLKLLDSIEKRLKENKTYEGMVERKNRCIRLNYANEFHMDILPAHPLDKSFNTKIKVPDRKAKEWKDSNPKGYTSWFNERSSQFNEALFEVRAGIEPLPDEDHIERKAPLKRAVQLMKRYRDIYFEIDPDSAPISIVLTTLAGKYYSGQSSVNETISHVLESILFNLPRDGGRLVVLNPTNEKEDLSERWDENPDLYKSFLKFIRYFKKKWDYVNELSGIKEIAEELKVMFGENVTIESFKDQADYVSKVRKHNRLAITGIGSLVAATKENHATSVKANTFYGS
ncbi:nucleotidyltransferase [Bacillus sp. FJAT-49736]|uniref:nucleotidyltransferase domain-containing protein n=1 Tax=Bacillus sp. FJAT-49736 TaxID=2833582 RepID=UPI001BC95356|nr:nucleotidyltransferase [Bacillus sp. FJAT-49736]MBS4171809.1 nucleotidyltransferase [Bacillus sp. FJAT-49736]